RARTAELEASLCERAAAERRLEFLAESGALFAASLDPAATLDQIGRRATAGLGDWCLVELLDADGRWRRHPVALGPGQAERLAKWERDYPPLDRTAADLPACPLALEDTAAPPAGLPAAARDQA